MHRTPLDILILGLLAAIVCAAGPAVAQQDRVAQDNSAPAEAERRLAELAQRYAGEQAGAASPPASPPTTPEQLAAEAAAIEEMPLGQSAEAASGEPDGENGNTPTGGWALSTLAALGVVIGLIFAARWAYTKMGGTVVARSSPVVEVLARTPVAPKNHVLLLRVGQRVLVVGDSSTGLRTLADLDDPEEVASLLQSVTASSERSVTKSFNSLVSRFNTDYDGRGRVADEGGDHQEVHLDRTRDSLSGLASRLRSLGGRSGQEDAA